MKLSSRVRALGALALVALSAVGGFFAYRALNPVAVVAPVPAAATGAVIADVVGQRRPAFSMTDYQGDVRAISEWDGKVLLINFWATWCPPCLEEIPGFITLQARYAGRGVQFVGVAIDERDNVREFADRLGLNYPSFQDPIAPLDLMRAYGNHQGGLPYTVLVAADGTVVFTRTGPLAKAEAERLILEQLGG